MAHTPGPWHVNVQGNTIRGNPGFVCGLNDVSPDDIRLLVAAPELLAALKLIAHATSPAPDDGGFHEAAYDIAVAAIAKAEAA